MTPHEMAALKALTDVMVRDAQADPTEAVFAAMATLGILMKAGLTVVPREQAPAAAAAPDIAITSKGGGA